MPNLAQALDALLTDRYRPTPIKSAADTTRGVHARMNALERAFTQKGDRKGAATKRVAAALGVSPRTWQRWRKGDRKPNTGAVEKAYKKLIEVPRMRRRLKNAPVPDSVSVTGVINWNGYTNKIKHRTVIMGGMRATMTAVIRAWTVSGPQAAAEAFEQGAAEAHSTGFIAVEGNDVSIHIPWKRGT